MQPDALITEARATMFDRNRFWAFMVSSWLLPDLHGDRERRD
jgi:hypothetical protein